jgi:amidase
MTKPCQPPENSFCLEEATIDELHQAIKAGRTTCVAVVQHYIDRVRAFNGVASMLVTEDGAPVSEATGAVRAMAPLRFRTQSVKASEFGRMEGQLPMRRCSSNLE